MSFPNMAEAMWDWETAIKFRVVQKVISDFEVDEKKLVDVYFLGCLQPMPKHQLMVKPEGQRHWKWYTMWTQQNLELDMILEDDAGLQYRVKISSDWNQSNYHEYELVQGVPNE